MTAQRDQQTTVRGMSRQHAAARAKFAQDALASVCAKLAGLVKPNEPPLSTEAQVSAVMCVAFASAALHKTCRVFVALLCRLAGKGGLGCGAEPISVCPGPTDQGFLGPPCAPHLS